jgi:hypothetical protein
MLEGPFYPIGPQSLKQGPGRNYRRGPVELLNYNLTCDVWPYTVVVEVLARLVERV